MSCCDFLLQLLQIREQNRIPPLPRVLAERKRVRAKFLHLSQVAESQPAGVLLHVHMRAAEKVLAAPLPRAENLEVIIIIIAKVNTFVKM